MADDKKAEEEAARLLGLGPLGPSGSPDDLGKGLPVTVLVPGARVMSPEERAALGQEIPTRRASDPRFALWLRNRLRQIPGVPELFAILNEINETAIPPEWDAAADLPQRNSNAEAPEKLSIVGPSGYVPPQSPKGPQGATPIEREHWSGQGLKGEALRRFQLEQLGGDPIGSAARERGERPSEKATVSEGSWVPRNWEEWLSSAIWGVLVLGFGLEFCAALVHGDYGHALVALFFFGVVSAMLLHGAQAKSWALSISPNWAYVATLVALQIVLFLPFIEGKQRPFSAWFPIVVHENATTEDIAKATAPIQEKLNETIKERDAAKEQLEKAKRGSKATEVQTGSTQIGPPPGNEIGYITVNYSGSSTTVTGASAAIKEAIVGPAQRIETGLFGSNSLTVSYSVPISISFNGDYGPFEVFTVNALDLIGGTGVSVAGPNITITKNESSHLDIIIMPANSILQPLSSSLLFSFRKK